MRKTKKIILTCLLAISMSSTAQPSKTSFDWNPVMDAIIQVESRGNKNARDASGQCVGILQMKKVLVDECNQILKNKKSKKRYSSNDRYSVEKSKEMFILLQEHFNKSHNVEKAIRYWNAGFYYEKAHGTASFNKKTQGYYNKVMKHYKTKKGGN